VKGWIGAEKNKKNRNFVDAFGYLRDRSCNLSFILFFCLWLLNANYSQKRLENSKDLLYNYVAGEVINEDSMRKCIFSTGFFAVISMA